MARKKSVLSEERKLVSTIKDSAGQVWLAGLGVVSKTQQESNRIFGSLVNEGEVLQKKSRKVADDTIANVSGKVGGSIDKLETALDSSVAKTLKTLGIPSRKEIQHLSDKVAELTALLEKTTLSN